MSQHTTSLSTKLRDFEVIRINGSNPAVTRSHSGLHLDLKWWWWWWGEARRRFPEVLQSVSCMAETEVLLIAVKTFTCTRAELGGKFVIHHWLQNCARSASIPAMEWEKKEGREKRRLGGVSAYETFATRFPSSRLAVSPCVSTD
ncbi:hypothetical protein O3P69_002464 [Scylla paramamosain]|uniref:Uncharacterized protein n=1 Tax=Scylla paramamosain TaxID=85552 RepID=A0AAW0UN57_SCYPA